MARGFWGRGGDGGSEGSKCRRGSNRGWECESCPRGEILLSFQGLVMRKRWRCWGWGWGKKRQPQHCRSTAYTVWQLCTPPASIAMSPAPHPTLTPAVWWNSFHLKTDTSSSICENQPLHSRIMDSKYWIFIVPPCKVWLLLLTRT